MWYDIAIVGAGMSGASLAAEIAGQARVVLLEAEAQPGYHSTGRSAAFWSESYGGPAVQPLTTASGAWLEKPPPEIADTGFLHRRGALHIAEQGHEAALDALARDFAASGVTLVPVDRAAIEATVPGIRRGWDVGLAEPSCADIDVAALHAAYLRRARRLGATLLCDAELSGADRSSGRWAIATKAGPVEADVLVDAAGAWAGVVAERAGAVPIAITPNRRTVVQLAVDPAPPADMPLVIDADERFYFKPEAGGRLWLSPHDETPVPACDVAPEELDIAIAIDRFEKAVDWRIARLERSWAGLRSFAPDRAPVYGFDRRTPGFFWFAGQGGFGIQTAPAGAMIGAALLTGAALPAAVADIDVDRYGPARF